MVPVFAPVLHAKNISRWSELNHGLDFSSIRRFAANEMQWLRRDGLQIEQLAPEALGKIGRW